MQGTIPQKIGRVVGNLATNPQFIPRYISHNVVKGKSPLDLEIPWLSYAVIDFLGSYLTPQMSVFEWGSGGSTVFMAKRTKSVRSIENDPQWFDMVKARLAAQAIKNVNLEFHAFDFGNAKSFESSSYLHSVDSGSYDVILIDGREDRDLVRPTCFIEAEKRIKPGGIIVIDDSWCYPMIREHNSAKKYQIFKSVGPCRPGVTSTDVFFY